MTTPMETRVSTDTDLSKYRAARDFLLQHRSDLATACAGFRWPQMTHFNWALDHFDALARDNHAPALWIVGDDGQEQKISFAQMAERSSRVANWLESLGVARGDRVLLSQINDWQRRNRTDAALIAPAGPRTRGRRPPAQ